MKKIIAYTTAVLMMATLSFAGQVTRNSTWDEIKADPTLKIAYPVIKVAGGVGATYDNFHIEGDMLKSGKTYTKDVSWDTVGSDDRRVNIKTETRDLSTPVDYTYGESKVIAVMHGEEADLRGPFVKVGAKHGATVMASVYEKTTSENRSGKFLFSKPFTISAR